MEVGTAGKYQFFGDFELKNDSANQPLTVISTLPSELYAIERHTFMDYIGKEATETFIKNQRYLPDDKELRKYYFQHISWDKYKKEVVS